MFKYILYSSICILLILIDNKLNKIGLSRLALCNGDKANQLLAALHFALVENSLEEVLMEVKQQYESLENELQKKLPPIFEMVHSIEDALASSVLDQMPKKCIDALFESIARCTKRQISHMIIVNQRPQLLNTFGKQFGPETNFYAVQFAFDSIVLTFAVTATRIKK